MVNKHQYAEVILGIKALDINHPFDYKVPENLDVPDIGAVVMVPFQSRLEIGYIVRLKKHSRLKPSQLKLIHSLVASAPVFDKFRIKLIYWMSFYYLQPLASVAQLFTPPGKEPKSRKIWEAVRADRKLEQLKVSFPLPDRQLQHNPGLKKKS
ncbi:MAG: hypothetical protein U5N58_10685 [Actinomycetota bacterium]|nr:hypothetical protein [Actinomycetota bacterium]